MYLFTRQGRLATAEGLDWAVRIAGAAATACGNTVDCWANTLSPGFGTVTWTTWWPDLTAMEAGLNALNGDAAYTGLAAEGATLIDGVIDDILYQTVSGEPDPSDTNRLVSGVRAICAGGHLVQAMTVGVEIAQKAEAITGQPTMFARNMTGPYSGVAWLTGFTDLGAYQTAMDKMSADPTWLALLDSTEGCFLEDMDATQNTLYAKLT